MDIQEIPPGTVISFEVYPSSQYGNNFQSVTLLGMFNAAIARKLGFDYIAANQSVYQTLPSGTPIDPTQYNYFQIQYPSGETEILGAPWIRAGTLTINSGKRLTVVIDNIDETVKDRVIAAILAQNVKPSSTTFV
ncbi:hypothetical protein ST201phi2-1p081 [Pseudomonas phage 201phi2-1]|uniref:SH3 fold domain-containing protein n=1 Tax=Pseudomonas phage 201phi2-1 TaxID=198110 RepID=B3FK56_BP201|nr:hypothetical protein ST201phi2-1p081 [Pseudomonas phage 201phi2-1]ABY62914.1 hypothetical protein 201phi2-1p081 [Pseudomonas phage 201phi2-1]